MTIDGYMAGPNGEMDWTSFNWDDELNQYVTELTATVDGIVLGRKLAEGFIPHWAAVAADPANPIVEAGKLFTNIHKVVFTKTLEQSTWDNTVLAKGDLVEEINALKNQTGQDMIAYGGASFVAALINANLVDEFYLFINPTAIGYGKAIFKDLENKHTLQLIDATAFPCGIVVLHYKPQ